jgi:hypothetical protein
MTGMFLLQVRTTSGENQIPNNKKQITKCGIIDICTRLVRRVELFFDILLKNPPQLPSTTIYRFRSFNR